MTRCWEPGTQYNLGDVVEFEGHDYKIIQAHSSQSDWAPNVTPALWGRLNNGNHNDHHQHQQDNHQQQQQQQPRYGGQQQNYSGGNTTRDEQAQSTYPSDEKVQLSHKEKKSHWYDIDDDRKKQIEMGGGLAAGAALLAGGYLAFKKHETNSEEQKAQTWALSNWVREAEARTDEYNRLKANGHPGPANWVLSGDKRIPENAIAVGQEHSWTLYICRVFYDGGIQIGKASDVFKMGAVVGYKHEEIHLGKYEVLVGDMRGLRWISASGRLNVSALGHKPVEGGRESDGTPLYIAKAPYNGAEHPGKASEKLDGAYIPYDGTEKNVKEYCVLCYYN